jgi:uncharacterized protein DUF6789
MEQRTSADSAICGSLYPLQAGFSVDIAMTGECMISKEDSAMRIYRRVIGPNWRPARAAAAGVLATAAYSLAMEGDISKTGNRFSDVRFIQGLMGEKALRQRKFLALAWLLHFVNGVALAELYAAFFKRFLPGPDWLKGAIFGEIFIVTAWWLTPLADKSHPLIKSGELPRLATWTAFLQNIGRHLVFGLALGLLYRDG